MPSAYTQQERGIAVETPLGEDVLLLAAFRGREEMSRLFSYRLQLLSENWDIPAKDIVGKAVSFCVRPKDGDPRYFHGCVQRWTAGLMADSDLRSYEAEVVPWLWFLTQTSDSRIFQNKSVMDIVEQVFGDLGFADYNTSEVKGEHPSREFCVQYRETDFQFISRLLEEEGVFYFFRHEQGKHTLVLADQKLVYQDCAESEADVRAGSHTRPHIQSWEHRFEYRPGKWTQRDYNYDTPTTDLTTTVSTVLDLANIKSFERYDYPGRYPDKAVGGELTKRRIEEEEAPYDTVLARGGCTSFMVGGKFKVREHDCEAEQGQAYAITAIEHAAREDSYHATSSGEQMYENSFVCIPDSVVFRPARLTPRPVVQGPQTAVVVGPSGEEIYVDDKGRVKVQFHWDREGRKDENSSCWVRVSQGWAGKTWGIVFHPRIGQEVVVDFLEGDPDRPLITGRVYNADQTADADAVATPTQSVIRTHSSPDGADDNFNELRFEDQKDAELISIHAEKDFERVVENNDALRVGFDKKDEGNQTIDIYNNRTVTIEEGTDTLTIKKGDRVVSIDEGNDELTIKQGDQTITITEGKCTIEAGTSIELKVGDSSLKIDTSSITLAAADISVTGDTTAEMTSATTTVNGDTNLTLKGGQVAIN